MSAWTLTRKDLAIYFRDPVGLALGLALPVALATVFGFAMGAVGGEEAAPRVRLYVEDHDRSPASEALLQALSEQEVLRIRTIDLDDDEERSARDRVAGGDGPAALVIPAGFAGAEGRALAFYRDPAKAVELQLITASLVPALFQARGEELALRAMQRGLDGFALSEVGKERAGQVLEETWSRISALRQEHAAADGEAHAFDLGSFLPSVLGLEVEDVVGDGKADANRMGAQSHSVSGIAVMMLLFGLVACGGTLLEEEAQGTLDRLRLSMGGSGSILAGKFLFAWMIGLVQLALLFAYGAWLFDVPIFRSPLALTVLSASVSAAATGFGILFAVLCRSRSQLEGLSTLVILTMSALGGSWWPLSMAPDWYQFLGHFTLTAWAMDGFQGIFWYGKDLTGILTEIGVLLAIAVLTSSAAAWVWSRRQGRA